MSAGAATHCNPAPGPGANPDLTYQIQADAYRHLANTLCSALPPPPAKAGVSDAPEDLRRRDHAAIAAVAGLTPANAAEAELGAQFVAASEQWKACLRLAEQPAIAPEWAAKCRAQAKGMMRQANSALGLLLRMQQARRKLEADSATRDRLAWTEHCALGLMAEALAQRAASAATGEPAPTLHPEAARPAPRAPEQAGPTDPLRAEPEPDAEPAASPPTPEPQPQPGATPLEHPRIEPQGARDQAATEGASPPLYAA